MTLNSEQELKAFEKKKVLRRFLKKDMTSVWRNLHLLRRFVIYKISYYSVKMEG